MKKRSLLPLLSFVLSLPAQDTPPAAWRTLLERAVFARAYESDPAAAEALFEQALAAAKASGDEDAAETVRQQQAGGQGQGSDTELILGRLLRSLTALDEEARTMRINQTDWSTYVYDEEGARLLAACLDGVVWLGGEIKLTPHDVLRIASNLGFTQRSIVLGAALTHRDPYVRSVAVRECEDDTDGPWLDQAMTDSSQVVREAACDRVRDTSRAARRAALLRAVELHTANAIDKAFELPGFVDVMRAAEAESWLAKAIAEQQPSPARSEGWTADNLAKTRTLIDWAAATSGGHAASLLVLAGSWLAEMDDLPDYPRDLARRVIDLALADVKAFSTKAPGVDSEALGYLVRRLGTLDDLLQLAPVWSRDPARIDDTEELFSLCTRATMEDLPRLLELGQTLANAVSTNQDLASAEQAARLCRLYWERLGRLRWPTESRQELDRAFAVIERLPVEVRRATYGAFVLGISSSPDVVNLLPQMESHYVRFVRDGLGDDSQRTRLILTLVENGSAEAPAAALAMPGDLGRYSGPRGIGFIGDFLIRACAIAPVPARQAVVSSIRRGEHHRPYARVPDDRPNPSWPAPGELHVNNNDRSAPLPSLLWVLPPDQAAEAVEQLWNVTPPTLPRQHLIETLLFAQSSRHAMAMLVTIFEQIDDAATKARVLDVFGRMLHEPARPLIAAALDSEEPVVRRAALDAAQKLLAYQEARAAMREPSGR